MKRLLLSLVSVLLLSSPLMAQGTIAAATMAATALPADIDTRAVTSMRGERIALYVTAATDILTTRHAIMQGAVEGNPLAVKIVGRTPSTLKLVGLKAASIGLTEWVAARERRKGNYKRAKALYVLSAMSWGYASGFNLRWAFK